MRTIIATLAALATLASGTVYVVHWYAAEPASHFRTEKVIQGDLLSTINATGTLEPVQAVDVGAQVTGRIASFGVVADPNDATKKKPVDYSSMVHKGDVLATIDDRIYKAQYDQAVATLNHAVADLGELEAKGEQSKQELDRAKRLLPSNAIAPTDYDLDECNYKVNVANVEVGKAAVEQAKAAVVQAKTNYKYCTIRSPVNGVIIARRVDIGQTVVSSMNASSLFLIGRDPKRIQPLASVNEADIGRIYIGQPVTFTVDDYPGETFYGTVCQIRLNATMTQNVVTYPVVIDIDNSDGRLKYYMTATLQFQGEKRSTCCRCPMRRCVGSRGSSRLPPTPAPRPSSPSAKAAPRTRPRTMLRTMLRTTSRIKSSPEQRQEQRQNSDKKIAKGSGGKAGTATPTPVAASSPGEPQPATLAKPHEDRGRIWAKDGNYVRPIDVTVGASDGTNTEVSGPGVERGHGGGRRRSHRRRPGRRRHQPLRSQVAPGGGPAEKISHGTHPTRKHHEDLLPGRSRRPGAQRHLVVHPQRRDGRVDGRIGLGQDDADEHPRLPGPAHLGPILARRRGDEPVDAEPAGAGADRQAGIRLPELQPPAADHGMAERR